MLTIFAEGVIKDTKFQVIDTDMAYNVILGRPWIHDMDVVPSTLHQVIKFPSQWGIRQIRGDQQVSKNINSVVDSRTMNEDTNKNLVEDVVNQISAESGSRQTDVEFRPDVIQEPEKNENIKTTIEKLEAVVLFKQWPDRKVNIGAKLSPEMRGKLVEFLKANADCFAWSHSDITGIPPEEMTHKLNGDPSYIPVKQKKRKQGSFKNQVIRDEIQKPLKIGSIWEVKY